MHRSYPASTDYTKDVRRLDQLRADKVCPERRESPQSEDFPRRAGLYAEVASRFKPSNKGILKEKI